MCYNPQHKSLDSDDSPVTAGNTPHHFVSVSRTHSYPDDSAVTINLHPEIKSVNGVYLSKSDKKKHQNQLLSLKCIHRVQSEFYDYTECFVGLQPFKTSSVKGQTIFFPLNTHRPVSLPFTASCHSN